ncbi:hypothetical protein PLICRDRAFT_131360 [Plicaturopsis crispa FD-325 SS-3]|nr:hypothetical protein PLICRDRAFT_131360 [Plicaturopsis crispa FD-325 SS-3]
MASLALRQTRSLFPALVFSRPTLSALLFPSSLVAPAPFRWALPTLQSLLELFPPFLLAVPKKKVSHSRKSMRSANKGLKDKQNIVNCPACGAPKEAHHLCKECFGAITRERKAAAKLEQLGST